MDPPLTISTRLLQSRLSRRIAEAAADAEHAATQLACHAAALDLILKDLDSCLTPPTKYTFGSESQPSVPTDAS